MQPLRTPTITPMAQHWLLARDPRSDRIKGALLSNIDGHRNVIELESFARAMGLDPGALERLRREGLIEMQPESAVLAEATAEQRVAVAGELSAPGPGSGQIATRM